MNKRISSNFKYFGFSFRLLSQSKKKRNKTERKNQNSDESEIKYKTIEVIYGNFSFVCEFDVV